MAALPIGLIKGHRNVKHERMLITDRRTETRARVEAIRNKVQLILLLSFAGLGYNYAINCK